MAVDAREKLDQWLHAVNQADVAQVLACYQDDAVLLPTFSNKSLRGEAGLRDYFERLGSRPNLRVELHDKTLTIQSLAGDGHALGGIYRWGFEVDGEDLSFEARFTFVLDGDGLIVHHHSSQVPRML
jgi:hypothetical protein